MTEAPEKMWVFPKADWFNAGASNVRISSAGANDVEYTRSDIAEAEAARLRAAIEPFADVSDFLASETEGLSDDDVFNLKLAGSKFLLMTYTAKQFHDARAALEYKD
jgi:hypothetical protein